MQARDRLRIDRALLEMEADLFGGDVIPLKGEYDGAFRRRVGSWRILFEPDTDAGVVIIHDIVRRSSTTY